MANQAEQTGKKSEKQAAKTLAPCGRINYDSLGKEIKLDMKDRRILTLLATDARMPLTRIAKTVKLSRDAVDYRIKRLQGLGVIQQFFADISYAKLGYYLFHVFVLMDEMSSTEQQKLIDHLKEHQNVVSVLEYSDRWDLEIVLIARDLLEFDQIILGITEKFSHIVLEKDKVEIIKKYRSNFLPPLLEEKKVTLEKMPQKREEMVKIDETDYKILRLLSKDARMTTYEMARNIKISSDTVSYRIKKLVKEGVIRSFSIVANLSLLKFHWYTFTVEMKLFNTSAEKKFEEFLKQHPQILRSAKTLGGWDLLLYIAVEHPKDYHKIIKDIKRTFSTIIKNYDAWIAYKEHIYKPMPEVIGRMT